MFHKGWDHSHFCSHLPGQIMARRTVGRDCIWDILTFDTQRYFYSYSQMFFNYDIWPTKVLGNYCNWEQCRRTMNTLLADAGTVTKSGSQIYHSDVIMSAMATLITGVSSVHSPVCSSTDQRKYQSSAPLALVRGIHRWPVYSPHKGPVTRKMFITRGNEMIMFSPCVFVCVWLSVYVCHDVCRDDLTMKDWCHTNNILQVHCWGGSSCTSYASRTHDVIDDITRSQSRSNFGIDISPSMFELQRRSNAQNVGNAHGYISGIFNFRYNFR